MKREFDLIVVGGGSGGDRTRLPAAGIWEGLSIVKGRYYTGTCRCILERRES